MITAKNKGTSLSQLSPNGISIIFILDYFLLVFILDESPTNSTWWLAVLQLGKCPSAVWWQSTQLHRQIIAQGVAHHVGLRV